MSEEIDPTSILVERVYHKFMEDGDLKSVAPPTLIYRLAETAVESLKNDGAIVGHPKPRD